MVYSIFPGLSSLTGSSVVRGPGYVSGRLSDRNKVFDYLHEGALVAKFDSVQSVFGAIKQLDWKPAREKSSDKKPGRDGNDFNKFNSLSECLDVFTNNPRSVREFKEEALRLTAEESIGKEIQFDVVGDYIDIGRFLDGEPECFGVAYQGNPSGLYTTMIINLSSVYHVTAEAMNHKQARILRLVDWMESQGVRCQIRGFYSTECAHMDVTVKDFAQSVDMNQLAVSMHSEFLRRVGFVVAEQSRTWTYGYGSPRDFSRSMRNNYQAIPEDGLTVFISDQSHSDMDDIDTAFNTLRDKIAELIESPQNRDFSKVYSVEL